MRKHSAVVLVLMLAPLSASARRITLVELFTAQGCATCNKANASVAKLADRPDVAVLTWSVDYWNYLGWKDTYARPEFAARQRAYDDRFGQRDVSTPQIVVGGAVQNSGDRTGSVTDLLKQARRDRPAPPQIAFSRGGKFAVGSGQSPRGGCDVWMVRYSPTEPTVEVKAGDNRGASVSERNVAVQLVRVGTWLGRPRIYEEPPATEDGLSTMVIVQRPKGGPIIAIGIIPET